MPAGGLGQGWRLGGLRRGLLGAAWLTAALAVPLPALAEAVVVLGRPLELALPQGFCRLEPGEPREAALARSIAQNEGASPRTILAFVDCHALEAWRAGGPSRFARVGWLDVADTGGGTERPNPAGEYLNDLREDMPRRSATEIVAAPGAKPALLVESARYLIHARMSDGPAPRLKVGALVNISGVAIEFVLVEAAAPAAADNALRLAEAAGQLAETVGEFFAVNDIFDDADALTEGPPSEGGFAIAGMAAALTLGSFFGIRAMWPLLRAPRRRSWPLRPPGL